MGPRLLSLVVVVVVVAAATTATATAGGGTNDDGGGGDDDNFDLHVDSASDLDLDGTGQRFTLGSGDDDELEEYSFESPDAVHAAWKSALEEFKVQAKESNDRLHEEYRAMQRQVSKGSMTKEEMKERREQLEREVEEQSGIPMSCQQGRQSCLHDENSPLIGRAVAEAKAHMTHRVSNQRSALRAALLPSLAMPNVAIGTLPQPPEYSNNPSNADDSAGGDGGGDGVLNGAASQVDDPATFALLEPGMQSYLTSVMTVQHVQNGAIVNTGALPFNVSEWEDLAASSRERKDKRTYGRDEVDVAWRIATEMQERHALANLTAGAAVRNASTYPTQADRELREWFEKKGGTFRAAADVEQDTDRGGHRRRIRAHSATGGAGGGISGISGNETLLRIPFRLTLNKITMRNVGLACKGKCSFLKEHFGPIFEKKEEWGLAVLLLHEHAKGNESRWFPFMNSLRMYMLSKRVLRELKGTFAAQLYRLWDEEAEAALWWVNEELCSKHTGKACNFGRTRKEFRWALGVVRSFAFNLTKRTSGRSFLSLVPYGNLLMHRRGAGGRAVLELDNTINLQVGAPVEPNGIVAFDRGQLGDAETMLRYFRVSEDDNPDNFVRLMLPGAQGERDDLSSFFFRKWKSTMEDWRRQMHYPPKQSDLWRMAKELNLYGYEDDDDEEKFLRSADRPENAQLLGALPMSTDEATAEEQLMLMGWARDEAAASLMLTGQADAPKPAMLYTAPELDENPHAEGAIQDMADAVLQLHEAIAAGHSDPAVQTVIAQTVAFFESGTAPAKGLDEIDRLLMRKRHMLKACGPAESHRINAYAFSDELLCAVRVTVMNESDVDVLCPRATGPWHDHNCDDGSFDPTRAVSPQNERAMIAALRNSVVALLDEAPTSVGEDEALLGLSSLKPALRAAIRLRLREKQLLTRALKNTDALERELDTLEARAEEQDRRAAEHLRQQQRRRRSGHGDSNGAADATRQPEWEGAAGNEDAAGGSGGAGSVGSEAGADAAVSHGDGEDEDEDEAGFDEDWDFLEGVGESESAAALRKARIKAEASTVHYFQLWARQREREAAGRRREERAQYVALVQEELRSREEQVVAQVPLNISGEITKLTLYRGEDLTQKVAGFFADHGLRAEAAPMVEKKLRAAARKADVRRLLLALPVVLDDGRLRVLAVHEAAAVANSSSGCGGGSGSGSGCGDDTDVDDGGGGGDGGGDDDALAGTLAAGVNVTQVVRKAFARWNVSLDMPDYEVREAAFAVTVKGALREHLGRRVLVEIPLDAPDGRKLLLQVRQGQQHDLETTVRCFVEAVGMSLSSIPQIVAAVRQRLPEPVVTIPINVPNRRKVSLLVSGGAPSGIQEEVTQFCRWHQLPDSNVPTLVKSAVKGANPNAFVL